ncbi:MAG: DUF6290 family protein [Desulfovibrionaceae bacterium]
MPTSVRLPAEAEERLAALAASTGRSKAYYIREAILAHLDEMEDIYLAEQARERVRRGEERTYSLDEIETHLGLAD